LNKQELKILIKKWILENLINSDKLEEDYFKLNEIKIDSFNSYKYKEINIQPYTKSYIFEDRCGNKIVGVYIDSTGEFKTGYKVEGIDKLIFRPEILDKVEDLIKPCADDNKIGTIYKILINEIIPNFTLRKKPNKLHFNPVSSTRERLTNILIQKIIKDYPQLQQKNNYIIHI
jgi:hypothetical protein